jgi:hypothetical protein
MIYRLVPLLLLLSSFANPQANPASAPDEASLLSLKDSVLDSRADRALCPAMPPERREQEIEAGLQAFGEISKDPQLMRAIIGHIGLTGRNSFGDDEKLLIYCEYKKLEAIHLEPWGDKYRVTEIAEGAPVSEAENASEGWTTVDREGHVLSMFVDKPQHGESSRLSDGKAPPKTPEPPPLPKIDLLDLRYRVVEHLPEVQLCAPRWVEEQRERTFVAIQKDSDTWERILQHLGLTSNAPLTDEQKRLVSGEYEKLRAITLVLLVKKYQFRFGPYMVLMDPQGQIAVLKVWRGGVCPL